MVCRSFGNSHRLSFGCICRPEPRRLLTIDSAVRGKGHTMVALGGLARDQPIGDIERDMLGVARGGIAKTAAAGGFEPDEIAAGHALAALGADRVAGDEADATGRAIAAAV